MSVLYIVSTPIGNLNDISLRAIETLKKVDFVAVEDTRHSKKLLFHFNIEKNLLPYHDFSTEKQTNKLLDLLQQGHSIALISDAGTPLIADPGYQLVKQALANDIQVTPIPGCSALVAALSVSGLPTHAFHFYGFLPAKSHARQEVFNAVIDIKETLIFYEAPHRILAALTDAMNVFGGDRLATVARELTKTYETLIHGSLYDLVEQVRADKMQQKGEFVVMISGCKEVKKKALPIVCEQLALALKNELPPKKIAKILAAQFSVEAKLIYQYIVDLKSS